MLRPVFLQRRSGGPIGIRKGSCRGNQRMRQRCEKARAEKQEGKRTTKSLFHPLQAGLDLAVAGTPDTNLRVMTLAVKPPESLQLVNLGVTSLDFTLQGRAELVHLAVILHREKLFLLGQLAIKLQPQ
jgi:hypothetical protein